MSILDRIIEVLEKLWDEIIFWHVLNEYEGGFIMRLGRYKRDLHVGLNFKIPFLEDVFTENITPTTMPLRAQTLTTKDGKSIVAATIVNYQIRNVRKFLLDIWDSSDVFRDTTMGAVRAVITDTNVDDITKSEVQQQILDIVQGDVRKYGVKVHRITFVDIGIVRSFRLISNPDEYDE